MEEIAVKKKVLFLCTHNSCRSQMAEGIINHDLGEQLVAFSAGTEATRVHSLAIKVLSEIGIDISKQYSKTLDTYAGERFDYVITLCGSANERCPLFFGGVERIHIGFEDPSQTQGDPEVVFNDFRRVRDELRSRLGAFLSEVR